MRAGDPGDRVSEALPRRVPRGEFVRRHGDRGAAEAAAARSGRFGGHAGAAARPHGPGDG